MTTPVPPTITLPGSYAIPAVAPVYADGILVTAGNGGPSTQVPGKQSGQDFWSSQLRPAGDLTAEQLVVSLAQPRLISYLALDVAHFPHTVTFYYWDGDAWAALARTGGAPLEILTTGSVPTVVDNPAALDAGLNPYHYGAGHWVHHDEDITAVRTARLMLRLVRLSQASGYQRFPVSPQGRAVPYPLGIRNLDFGLRLRTCDDAPYTLRDPEVLSLRQPFTTTTDVRGSPVQVAIRENRACDLLRGQQSQGGAGQ